MTTTTPQAGQGSHFWFMSLMQSAPGRGFIADSRSGGCTPPARRYPPRHVQSPPCARR